MKPLYRLIWIIPLVLASFACSLAADGTLANKDTRPVLNENVPNVVFLSPITNERYALGMPVILYVEARDIGAGIMRVEFYDNFDELIGTVTSPQASPIAMLHAKIEWTPPLAQRHFVKAKAIRADGTASPETEVSIEVVDVGTENLAPSSASSSTESQSVAPLATEEVAPSTDTQAVAPAQSTTIPTQAPIQDQSQNQNQVQDQSQSQTQGQTVSVLQATVKVEAVQVRVSPDQSASIAALLTSGQSIQLVGRSADNLWYATPLQTGGFGWVFGNLLDIQGDASQLPLATTQ